MTINSTQFRFRLILLFIILCTALFSCAIPTNINETQKAKCTADGPYVLRIDSTVRIITIDKNGKLSDKSYPESAAPKELMVESEMGNHRFNVTLSPSITQPVSYAQPEKLLALSDPHGDFDSFVSILKAGKVINDRYEWSYGKNQVVVIGDVFDRGVDVLPIFWLCYKLDREAAAAGGKLHFIIGNHEDMVLSGNLKYSDHKYKAIAKSLNLEYKELFAANTELGSWLRTKNYIEVIGQHLFVHAGISKTFLERNASLDSVNATMQRYLGVGKANIIDQQCLAYTLFSSNGILWYRGMVKDDDKYEPLDPNTLALTLQRYNVSDIIVGHTIFDDITLHSNGRIIPINVDNAENRAEGKGRAILIEKNRISVVHDNGSITPIK